MIFPIYECNGNELTSLKGEVSRFFEVLTPDLSQMPSDQIDHFYHKFQSELKNFREECFYKLYYINDQLFLNTNDLSIESLADGLIAALDPLKLWLGDTDVFEDIEIYDDYFLLGTEYCRLLNFYELPSKIDWRFLEQFGDSVIHLKKLDPLKAKKKLNFKRKMHFSLTLENLRNIESEKAFGQSEDLLEKIMTGEEAVFQFEGWFVARGRTKLELDSKTQKIKRRAKLLDLELLTEVRSLAYFFNATMPGVRPTFTRGHLAPNSFVSGMLPLPTEILMENGFLLNTPSGRSVTFDLFCQKSTNFNLLVTGATGQGKSMVANKVLKEELPLGTKAIVLDLGNSFKKTVSYYEGVSFSEKFNPLEIQNSAYLKAFVLSVVGKGYFTKQDEGRLFEFLKAHENETYGDFDQFLLCLEGEFRGISYFFSEVKEYFTNEKRKVSNLTYCDLSLYPESIKAPLIIYLIEHFKHLEGKKVFIFDEVWGLLLENADYIAHCFRTFRKHFASAVAISQNLEDFLTTELGRVIYQNSCHKFLFRQDVETELLDSHSSELLNQVSSEKGIYGEFLVITDTVKKIVRYFPTLFEFELFNTDKWEVLKFEKFFEERKGILDFQSIFDRYVFLKHGELQ
ncbi:hypothetical protein SHI21_19610 [Bacteriovorax sp. PP10]|uniref:TraG P-loop domain-containing protein n=1 Tax=Bacteriovorax antarcticus TaxID=3088717 RepID=A0ABU5VZG3_9BACT|nr:hypothetical protein [Bacteriovorax sp. PP10]MEA9358453.1 hypothetical protein [Bacteriovorax sp. PP10]